MIAATYLALLDVVSNRLRLFRVWLKIIVIADIIHIIYMLLYFSEYRVYRYIMLNLNDIGRPLAKIIGGKYDGKQISVSDKFGDQNDETLIKEFKQLKIPNDAKLQQVPDTTKEREIIYMTGPSGSGKSTYVRKYLEQFKKKNKDHPIYIFSSLPEDESLDAVKPQRIRLDESIYQDPIAIEDLSDSVVIFDDIDVISDKKIRDAVYNILNKTLEIGRQIIYRQTVKRRDVF